jgi:ribosomal protein S18 acetylase RimI-like enzyme
VYAEPIVTYRDMTVHEIDRIGEVNRAEALEAEYLVGPDGTGLGLVAEWVERSPPLQLPPWSREGVERRVRSWRPALAGGGRMRGAFDQGALIGFVILGATRRDASAEVVALFIDRDHRRRGIAGALLDWVEERARERGIAALFVGANPTASALGFYRRRGFEVVRLTSKALVPSLPGDVLLAKWVGPPEKPSPP